LSSSNPNLQNIPIRTDLGKKIRYAFVAKEDHVLLSADYSQIELRLAAELAHDDSFVRAFKDGADIHRRTAAEVWNISEEEVTKEQRAAAKAINFSILYGVGPRALARSTGMHFEEAREFIARYFAVHPGIQAYIDAMKLQARSQGYVQTLFGRRRYLPDITSGVPQLVAAAERMAMNMPIQGTQADIIKMAMITLSSSLEKSDLRAKLLLQVHDELIFEVHEEDVQEVEKLVREKMVSVATFKVPLVVDVATGKSWGDIV
jgi:DNA polymerase-1